MLQICGCNLQACWYLHITTCKQHIRVGVSSIRLWATCWNFNELQTIFINAFFPSFCEGSSNILQIFRSSFLFFFATEEYEFNSGNVFTNSSAILDFCLPPQMQSIMGNWKIENTWLNFALIILWPLRSLMVIKLLASARNSPMAPWSAGLLFSLSVAGEALLDLGSVG